MSEPVDLNAYDSFGLVQIPTTSAPLFSPISNGWREPPDPLDPALAVLADWLAVFLVEDDNIGQAWRQVRLQESNRAVKTIWLHNPTEIEFNDNDTPSLYLWRQSAEEKRDWDDGFREYTVVKGLWVFPTAMQSLHIRRVNFPSILGKAIRVGIERGRTPSWKQPNDSDPHTAAEGSLFWTYMGFDELEFVRWDNAVLTPKGAEPNPRGYQPYPAVDLTFLLTESLRFGLGRQPPYSPDTSLGDTVTPATPTSYVTWSANTNYAPNAFVVPPTANGFYYLGQNAAGKSAASAPAFPLASGDTVTDGSMTWTCMGPIDGSPVTGVFQNS